VRDASSGGELDLRVAAELLPAIADPADRLGERLVARHPQLVLEVDVRGRDEYVEVGPLRDPDCLDRFSGVTVAAAGQRGGPRRPGPPFAIRLTASQSPGEAAGKPASMTSTVEADEAGAPPPASRAGGF